MSAGMRLISDKRRGIEHYFNYGSKTVEHRINCRDQKSTPIKDCTKLFSRTSIGSREIGHAAPINLVSQFRKTFPKKLFCLSERTKSCRIFTIIRLLLKKQASTE